MSDGDNRQVLNVTDETLIGRINIFDWTGRPDLAYPCKEFVKPSTLKAFLLSQSDNVKLTASGLVA